MKNQTWCGSETALLLNSQTVLNNLRSATTLQCSSPSFYCVNDKIFFSKMGQPRPLFVYFCFFILKILVASRIQTGIVGEEGEDANHLTTTTAVNDNFLPFWKNLPNARLGPSLLKSRALSPIRNSNLF